MEPGLYFRVLSIALGTLLALRGPVLLLIERRRRRAGDPGGPAPSRLAGSPFDKLTALSTVEGLTAPSGVEGQQPFLAWLAAVVALVVVAATWWMHIRRPVPYSAFVTVVATLGLVWTSQVLFNYARFRELQRRLATARPGTLAAFRLGVALVGVALILLGVFVYR